MRFLTVADRELRSAARQKSTYRARWGTAVVFFLLLLWLLWVYHDSSRSTAPEVFRVYSILIFLYCAFISTARTADSISAERREGTLGLLFLTNLDSAEILAGKLCSSALASVYGLMAIFPMLALPLMMGGITFGHFARTVVALLAGILFSLAAGFLASVTCKRQFTAVAVALGLTLGLGGGLVLGSVAANVYPATRHLGPWLGTFSPLYTLMAADPGRIPGSGPFWRSALAVTALSVSSLGLTTLVLARTWRDRPQITLPWQRLRWRRRTERRPSTHRIALRRRMLGINPLFWLAARQTVSAPVFMVLAAGLTLITVYLEAPYFGRTMMTAAGYGPVLGHLFAWLWTALALHALVLYYAATVASQRLAEDKQTGALELILSTSTSERTLSRGLWLAFARKMLFPTVFVVLVSWFFIWLVLVMMTLDPPGHLTVTLTPAQIFWSALLDRPVGGRPLDWQFGFILRIPVLVLLQLMLTWPTLGWVGRWLGLRFKHPGFAPMASLALLFGPPVLLFSFCCYVAAKLDFGRMPERRFLPMMMYLAFGIGVAHCVGLSAWAARRLRTQLRAVALSRYQPLPPWRLRLPSARAFVRFALAAGCCVAAVALLIPGYYGYQNWRSRRAWKNFQMTLKQNGEPLQLTALLPSPVPDATNFARSPIFLSLLRTTNRATTDMFIRMSAADLPASGFPATLLLMDWHTQAPVPLRPWLAWTGSTPQTKAERKEDAAAFLQGLQRESEALQAVASAAARLPCFSLDTNQNAEAIFCPPHESVVLLERLQLLFAARGCASLAVGSNAAAAADGLTALRLARLAGQIPDARSPLRVQTLLGRALQPLWEGLRQRAWNEPQLAALQQELAGFNLLADYTNTVRRAVLAHIDLWREIPDHGTRARRRPVSNGVYLLEAEWQPRAWWFDSCIQLHEAGRTAMEQIDFSLGRVQPTGMWSDLNGLPLDAATQELLQQPLWNNPTPGSLGYAQTSLNQALIACALERFYLASNSYPESLNSLVPALLPGIPHDSVSGRPVIYQPQIQNRYILRGVGPNGLDDRKNTVSDDWLWSYTTNKPSAKKPAAKGSRK